MSIKTRLFVKFAIIFLFVLGLCVRLYHFPDRVTFTLEQGITLQTTHDYLHGKFSLLGLVNVQRYTSTGLQIFSGPLYNYVLMPIMFVFGNNPITITYFALMINLLTAVALYLLIKDLSGRRIAFFSTLFFLFSITMISQSLTLWILNPLPLVGLLGMYLLLKYTEKMPSWVVISLGLLSGIAISLEYMCLFTVALVGIYLVYKSQHKLRDLMILVVGTVIPLAPTIIFDLRHDWYHLGTLWQYTIDTLHSPGQGAPRAYHFFHLYPVWFYFLGYITSRLTQTKYQIGYYLAALYMLYGTTLSVRAKPLVSTPTLLEIGSQIADQANLNYNVVYMPEAEYRGYSLRYILTIIHNKPPLPIDAYPSSSELYVVATPDRSLDVDIPWEIAIFKPVSRELVYTSNDKQVLLYKLSK